MSLVLTYIEAYGRISDLRHRMLFLIAFSIFYLLNSSLCNGRENEIKDLITILASPNDEPVCDESTDDSPVYPAKYDHAAQERVVAARDALLAKGLEAFPELIGHVDDRRYSYNEQREKTFCINLDVGYVCYRLIAVQVQAYQPLVKPKLPPSPIRFWVPRDKQKLRKWWQLHKHQSLREIQLDAAKWAYAYQSKADFRDDDEKAAALGVLQALITRLETSEKAIRFDFKGKYLNEPDLELLLKK
jgi:hypothetical protein